MPTPDINHYPVHLHDNDEDPRVVAAHHILIARLRQLAEGTTRFDLDFVRRCEQLIYDHRVRFKQTHGIPFPELGPFVLPSVRSILFFRRDLTDAEVRGKLIEVVRAITGQGLAVSATELAVATQKCWPGYRPPIEELRQDPKLSRPVLS